MSEHDPNIYLAHILECIEAIERYTNDIGEEEFFSDPLRQDAVVRRFGIIGEAVKNLSGDYKSAHPRVPWKRLSELRGILVDQDFVVDLDLTWAMVQNELPDLKRNVVALRGNY